MSIDSSRVIRSAGSAASPDCPTGHSVRSGTGSGIHWPTYRSLRARAEPSWSRQIRLVTVVSHAGGDAIASRSSGERAYQRMNASWTASSASAREPSSR